jgi:hypothetical protein
MIEVRRFSSVRCRPCGETLISTSRHDFRQCGCPQETFVDGGSEYLRTGGADLRLIEVLVDPSWPAGVSLALLRDAHRLAEQLHCRFDPPAAATGDDVSRAIDWMRASLELTRALGDDARTACIGAGGWPPTPEGVGPRPVMLIPPRG